MDLTEDAIKLLVSYGRDAAGPQFAMGANIPYVMDGSGNPKPMPELLYNEHATRPERVKTKAQVLDPVSFVEYWQKFADKESVCFANELDTTVTGILDYHESSDLPRWCQHRVILMLQLSEEWKMWVGNHNKQMTQQQFAEFLEQHSMDIKAPSPGAMMEIARDLIATTESQFAQGIRMRDGQVTFKWTETVNAKVGGGELAVPEHFTINLPVFVGGGRLDLQALFRFRVKEGHLTMWYTLVRSEEALRQAFIVARDWIAGKLGKIILNGTVA